MAEINLPSRLLARLQRIADYEHRSLEEVLTTLIEGYPLPETVEEDAGVPPAGTLARMAYEAQRAGIFGDNPDLVDQRRTILREEFTDHLLRRLDADEHPSSDRQ